ncbi:hypothetical protein YC2023_065504 [Brassica napus]
MIIGFSYNGLGKEALKLFSVLESTGKEPNSVTFLALLSACAHFRNLDLGWTYFRSMISWYGTGPDHYASSFSSLGQPSWCNASKICLLVDLAELAAKKLIELEPDTATPYRIRNIKKPNRIKMDTGSSWIILKGCVHNFLAGDEISFRSGRDNVYTEDVSKGN